MGRQMEASGVKDRLSKLLKSKSQDILLGIQTARDTNQADNNYESLGIHVVGEHPRRDAGPQHPVRLRDKPGAGDLEVISLSCVLPVCCGESYQTSLCLRFLFTTSLWHEEVLIKHEILYPVEGLLAM